MNIIIAGAGKVGFDLAKTLCIGHNIVIIDKNKNALDKISESLDILTIHGNLENINTYQSFIETKIDLFIVVTDIDNINIVTTLMADTLLNIDKIFIRLQNPSFIDTQIQEKLNIDTIILPTKIASHSIASLLNYPKVNNIKFFKYTDYRLASIIVSSEVQTRPIGENKYNIIGIERNKNFFIPQSDDEIQADDLLYFFAQDVDVYSICDTFVTNYTSNIEKCVIFGGEDLGIAIAKALLDIKKDVKLVEKDLEICENANEILEGKVSIINSKYGTIDLFEDESLDTADIFISATRNDEYNIIKCLEAKERGVQKVVAINNEVEYYNLMHSLGIIAMRGPKMSTYNTIMEEINSTGIILEKHFCGAKAIVYMRRILVGSKHIAHKIKPMPIKDAHAFYIRKGALYPLSEMIIIEQEDILMTFCKTEVVEKVKRWIYEL